MNRSLCAAALAAFCSTTAVAAHAGTKVTAIPVETDKQQTVTFSRLVLRIKGSSDIGLAPEAYRVQFLERMRKLGYPALGAESLVFDQDKSDKASFAVGGTIQELACNGRTGSARFCVMGIRWELLNRRTNQVVYKLLSRFSTSGGTPEQLGEKLALGAFYSLLARPKFSEAMRVDETAEQEQESYTQAKFKSCRTQRLEMPARAEDALKATVLVEAGGGLGSGALISPDGLILTAAHVVRDADVITVQFRGGEQAEARLVRINTHSDVALLKAETTSETACVPLRTDAMRVGDEVYAIGSPLSKELSFTLTRGIVSADREIEGVKLLQTDASVNPGNSGGPLLDKQGRWAALVSWKVVGRGVQGIAFGVPTQTTIQALGLTASDQTEQVLTRQMAHTAAASGNDGVEDTPDPVIPLTDRRTMDSPRETDPITDRNFDRPTKPKETETDAGMLVVGIGLLATASGVLY